MENNEVDFEAKGYTPKQIELMKLAEKTKYTISLGIRFSKGLKNYPCYSFDFYTTLFSQYDQHGTLPFPGVLTEQPNFIIEVFNTIKSLVNESHVKQQKAQEPQSKRRK